MGPRLNPAPPARSRLGWLYLLALVPVFTDLGETGTLPRSLREWLTEVVGAIVIGALVHRVRRQHALVEAMARTDALTGLFNRGEFDDALDDECARARRFARPLTLLYIDLDRFKQLNDRLGHRAGDRALQQLAAAIGGAVRAHVDRAFRIGGDEFALLLPGTAPAQATAVVARIRERCEASDALWRAGTIGMSVGVAEYQPPESAADLVARADDAMYRCKAAQRPAAAPA